MAVLGICAGAGTLSLGSAASAEPQANLGLRPGVVGTSTEGWWSDTGFHLALHGDVLFGRTQNRSFGLGPFAEVATQTGAALPGGGLTLHLPIHAYLPALVSAGGYGRWHPDQGWSPGISAEVFVGSRSFNYHSSYVMAGGLIAQVRLGFGGNAERSIVIAAHLDGEILALPFVLLYEALSGSKAK